MSDAQEPRRWNGALIAGLVALIPLLVLGAGLLFFRSESETLDLSSATELRAVSMRFAEAMLRGDASEAYDLLAKGQQALVSLADLSAEAAGYRAKIGTILALDPVRAARVRRPGGNARYMVFFRGKSKERPTEFSFRLELVQEDAGTFRVSTSSLELIPKS
jgi:hypothetical protein